MMGVRPVAAYLEIGIFRPYSRDIVTQVVAECLPVELLPFEPSRVFRRKRGIHSGLFLEQLDRLGAIINGSSPTLTVHPDSINTIFPCQFFELWNQQFVNIGAENGSIVLARIPVLILYRPFRMEFHCPGIPDSGIMKIKGDSVACGHLAPDSKRVSCDSRGRIAHKGGIT